MDYALEIIKKEIADLMKKSAGVDIKISDIEIPPAHIGADLAVPIFRVAKEKGLKAEEIFKNIKIKPHPNPLLKKEREQIIANISLQGGFLNFYLNYEKFAPLVLADFQKMKDKYGADNIGKGKKIVIDYSAPNIGKPFSVGHLRSIIIGQALYNIYSFLGYKVIGDNHLGDWGTQFGKLICAYKKWGNEEMLKKEPIKELLNLYVKFHEEAKKDLSLDDEGRAWFKKLEDGDKEALSIWKKFIKLSLAEYNKIYKLLGVKFDFAIGESFYNNKTSAVIKELESKNLLERDNGVALIKLDKYGINTPFLVQKSDEASLYGTRELATAIYRAKEWQPEKILYVVGNEQNFYFKQFIKVLELMNYKIPIAHIGFGLMRLPEGKMSTREGRVIFLEDVLNQAIQKAKDILKDRDFSETEKDKIAKIVGLGAVKYADLSQNRNKDVIFDWGKILNLEGDSAPYLQYAYVRINSILKKSPSSLKLRKTDSALLKNTYEVALLKNLALWPEIIKSSAETYHPHIIADYLFNLSQDFNSFYANCPVLNAESVELKNARLALLGATAQTIKTGLQLLGIECPEKM